MKKTMCLTIDKNLYHKIHVIHAIKKYFFDEKDSTISSIAEEAFIEYFKTHEKEINELIKKYKDQGGCFDI